MPTPETRDAARVHELKCWPEFFAALLEGRKTFEVRLNDRDYQVGDVLRISEWSRERGYTGNSIERTVTYVMEGGRFGLDSQYVVLGLSRTPPAGVVVWVARDDDGDMSLFLAQPHRTELRSPNYWYGPAESTLDEDAVEPIATALGLAPGECARVRLTREEREG